jgi:hypothetical protein
LGSAVAQPALPQVSGSGVAIGSVGQFPVPHKLNALPRSVIRITESVLSAVLASFSRALVGRTQPTLFHVALGCYNLGADGAAPVLARHGLHAPDDECETTPYGHLFGNALYGTFQFGRAAENERRCDEAAPDGRLSQSLAKTRLVLGCPLKKWFTSSKTSNGSRPSHPGGVTQPRALVGGCTPSWAARQCS